MAGRASSFFNRVSRRAAVVTGRPLAFALAAGLIVVWALTGPVFGFNDTWQLVINTTTTIITFLMVFLIQNSQERDTAAIHLKLDELISVIREADDRLLDLEELDEEHLEEKRKVFEAHARAARAAGAPTTATSKENP